MAGLYAAASRRLSETWESRLEGHFSDDGTDTVAAQIDLWLTLLAAVACVETLGVCVLATYRYSGKLYHLPLQRWTIRLILIGPVFSILMWASLWTPDYDYYIAIPVGFYEAYAFFCFYAMLVAFAGGEDRVVTALSALPGPPTAYVYHPFGVDCTVGECGLTLGTYTPLFGGRVHYSHAVRFASADGLLRFLKRGVAQAMVAKPLNLLLMIFLNARGQVALCNYSRVISIVSFWFVANSLTQLYHVTLPRIRGMGGEKLFVLLLLMISVITIQDIVVSVLLINSDTSSATSDLPTRLIFIITILEFTAFSTIFYRLLPPEKFAAIAWRESSNDLAALSRPRPHRLPIFDFWLDILNPRTMFAVARRREDPAPYKVQITHVFGAKEEKADEDERTALVRN